MTFHNEGIPIMCAPPNSNFFENNDDTVINLWLPSAETDVKDTIA